MDNLKKWVKELFKKNKEDHYGVRNYNEFILCTEENERIYKIKRYQRRGLMGQWEDVYASKDGINVLNRYEAILSKLEKDNACKRLENAKKELKKAEREAKKHRVEC